MILINETIIAATFAKAGAFVMESR